jgi:hypothetical protein
MAVFAFGMQIFLVQTQIGVLLLTGRVRASRKIHNDLVNAALGTTFRWIDTHPTSRVSLSQNMPVQLRLHRAYS